MFNKTPPFEITNEMLSEVIAISELATKAAMSDLKHLLRSEPSGSGYQ